MEENNSFVRLWNFENAPDELKYLSDHGGDEDWIALVPASMKDKYYSLIECSDYERSGNLSRKELTNDDIEGLEGYILYIGSHS